jgi:fumarylacetoacetate (FAA) hydrolase
MKLATYKDGSRDGQLVVVSRDLSVAHYATGIAHHLQQVLDDWNFMSPQLQDLYVALNQGKARHAFPFDPTQCMAPLPRAHQWVSGTAYVSHTELLCQAAKRDVPQGLRRKVVLSQGAGDALQGPCDEVACDSEAQQLDFEAGLAAITGDVPRGAANDHGLDSVRLLMLVNDMALRQLMADDGLRATPQARPATVCSPVAVTPDELGETWQGGRVHLTLQCGWNGRTVGMLDLAESMYFHFGQVIAQLAHARPVRAGSVVGSGVVSLRPTEDEGRKSWPKGYASIAEKRAMEMVLDGQAVTDFLKDGDTLRFEVKARDGQSVFGAIEHKVAMDDAGRPAAESPAKEKSEPVAAD